MDLHSGSVSYRQVKLTQSPSKPRKTNLKPISEIIRKNPHPYQFRKRIKFIMAEYPNYIQKKKKKKKGEIYCSGLMK